MTTVKGLLKGLRYISQIFEAEKKEEMQIGVPTDVKHVAHIGWDSPSVMSPSWMNEFKSMPSPTAHSPEEAKSTTKILPLDGTPDLLPPNVVEKPKTSRRHHSSSGISPIEASQQSLFDIPKHSRRHHSSGGLVDGISSSGASVDSDLADSIKGRRHKTTSLGISSPSRDSPIIPKHSRRRKSSKGSNAAGESNRSSRKGQRATTDTNANPISNPANPNSDPISKPANSRKSLDGLKNSDGCKAPLPQVGEHEKLCDEVS